MTSRTNTEVYAIRYAHRDDMTRKEHFYRGDVNGEKAMPLDYFVWVVLRDGVAMLIDAGFTEKTARRREGNREFLQSPGDSLLQLGIVASQVQFVVLTHLHFDHTGHIADFPDAQILVQRREYDFWTGPYAKRGDYSRASEPADLAYLATQLDSGRLQLLDGDTTLLAGISVHRLGGHTPGMQVLRVVTDAGNVVIASDATHFYENIETDRPYSIVDHVPSAYGAFDRLKELASPEGIIVPGHDPLVFSRFESVPGLEGIALRIA